MNLVRRRDAWICIGLALAAGCGSKPAATAATATNATSTVRTTPSTPGNIGSARATKVAESLAVPDAGGNPKLSQPTATRFMSFQDALTTIGSSPDYSHAPNAPVWLVHVYGEFSAAMRPPPRPGVTSPSSASTTSNPSPPPSFFVIIDATTGQVIVENY